MTRYRNDFLDAGLAQVPQRPFGQRDTPQIDHRLRPIAGERAKAAAFAGREVHGWKQFAHAAKDIGGLTRHCPPGLLPRPPYISRMAVPPLRELEAICGGEGRDPADERDFRIGYARLVRPISIRFTWLLLHTRLSANQVTVLAIAIGMAGALLLAWSDFWPLVLGLVLLQLSFVLDYSDGEIARYQAHTLGTSPNAGGAFLDWIGHYYVPATMTAALAYGAFHVSGRDWLLLAALVVVFSLVRVAYSARDHVMLGLLRDHPELDRSAEFRRAVLARQGGDPELIDLDADYTSRRAGASGRGPLWRRHTNLGQVLVFPGFVNLVTLAVLIDLVLSSLDGDYPAANQAIARMIALGGLGLVHVLHQLRAAVQGFQILRRLG
jgi:phosphatidylglycerophosphate synthase